MCGGPCCSPGRWCGRVGGPYPLDGDPGWLEVHAELPRLHREKSSTYGTGAEPLNNFVQLGAAQDKPAERYVWERIIEKSLRALQMIDAGGADDVEEGADVASLAIIAEALRRRRGA